jgi:predicted dehydrogenase
LNKRILIVGQGSIGKRHLRIARTILPNADIGVLAHRNLDHVPQFANIVFLGLEEALIFRPHMAVIASPAPFHLVTAQALAQAGTHLLIEKPLSVSLLGARKLINTCKQQGAALLLGYNLRFSDSLQYYRTKLSQGVIGKVLSVRAEAGHFLPLWRPGSDYKKCVSARSELGGGVLLELSHELDYLSWIFGNIEWVKAELSRQSSLEIDVEDTAHLVMGFKSSINGYQTTGTLSLDFVRQDATRACMAIGENGSLRWDGLTGRVDIYKLGDKEWENLYSSFPSNDSTYIAEWRNFIGCVEGADQPFVGGEDGVNVLHAIEAARRSSDFGGVLFKTAM